MAPEGMLGRQRLRLVDVEGRVGELARGKGREQVGLDEMLAARRVDDGGTLGQAGEERAREDALGRARERQEADEDLAPCEEGGEARAPWKLSTPSSRFGVRLQPATLKPRPASALAALAPSAPSPMMPTPRSEAVGV